jgi:hypothetical protein
MVALYHLAKRTGEILEDEDGQAYVATWERSAAVVQVDFLLVARPRDKETENYHKQMVDIELRQHQRDGKSTTWTATVIKDREAESILASRFLVYLTNREPCCCHFPLWMSYWVCVLATLLALAPLYHFCVGRSIQALTWKVVKHYSIHPDFADEDPDHALNFERDFGEAHRRCAQLPSDVEFTHEWGPIEEME